MVTQTAGRLYRGQHDNAMRPLVGIRSIVYRLWAIKPCSVNWFGGAFFSYKYEHVLCLDAVLNFSQQGQASHSHIVLFASNPHQVTSWRSTLDH